MTGYADRLDPDALAIFLFHGVVERLGHSVRNYTRKHLDRDYFQLVLTDLKRSGRPLSMDEVIDHVESGRPWPPRAFAVTFDDGFANNYTVAAPLLADLDLPATFYVTTGFVEHNSMSWIDRIELCLENSPAGSIKLPWRGETVRFDTIEERVTILDEVRARVKIDRTIDPHALADDLFDQCGLEPVSSSDDPLDLKMTWQQVRDLHRQPGFIVGGHTHTHATLSFLSAPERRREIERSLELLADKAGVSPRHYSYPEGQAHCYSPEVIADLQGHGVVCCPTAIDGLNRGDEGLFHLRRIMVD